MVNVWLLGSYVDECVNTFGVELRFVEFSKQEVRIFTVFKCKFLTYFRNSKTEDNLLI